MAIKKPDLDEATLRIVERMLQMPPKLHDEMKVGKPKARKSKKTSHRRKLEPKQA